MHIAAMLDKSSVLPGMAKQDQEGGRQGADAGRGGAERHHGYRSGRVQEGYMKGGREGDEARPKNVVGSVQPRAQGPPTSDTAWEQRCERGAPPRGQRGVQALAPLAANPAQRGREREQQDDAI